MSLHRGIAPLFRETDQVFIHQTALQDDLCIRDNMDIIADWHRERGLPVRTSFVNAQWPDGKSEKYRLHCFIEARDAEAFIAHFGAEPFSASMRGKGKHKWSWLRQDEYRRVLDSGPLSVPPLFRN